jgi:hypothetical protein
VITGSTPDGPETPDLLDDFRFGISKGGMIWNTNTRYVMNRTGVKEEGYRLNADEVNNWNVQSCLCNSIIHSVYIETVTIYDHGTT